MTLDNPGKLSSCSCTYRTNSYIIIQVIWMNGYDE